MSVHVPKWLLLLAREAAALRTARTDLNAGPARPRHVVVVDADDESRAWYTRQMRVMGHEVDEAGDPKAAITILQAHPDAVVLAHFAVFSVEEQTRLREYLAAHHGLPVVMTTTPVHEDRPTPDDQDTARIRAPGNTTNR